MTKGSLKNLIEIPIFTALMAICAYIQIPFPLPFTLQLFAVSAALLMLGGARGFIATAVYMALGAVGLPVFSGFSGGIGHIFSLPGGFLLGLLLMAAIYLLCERLLGSAGKRRLIYLAVGLIFLYTGGVLWLVFIYAEGGEYSVGAAILSFVLPYILPDTVKILTAYFIAERLKRANIFSR